MFVLLGFVEEKLCTVGKSADKQRNNIMMQAFAIMMSAKKICSEAKSGQMQVNTEWKCYYLAVL